MFLTSRQKGERQSEGSPFYVTGDLPDWHLTRPGSICFPLTREGWLTDQQKSLGLGTQAKSGSIANHSPTARSYLAKLGIDEADSDPETASSIWKHCLAIGYSPAYLTENADGIRQDWPRIPLPESKGLLLASAALGRKIAALLDTEAPFDVGAPTVGALPGRAVAQATPPLQRIAVPTRIDGKALDETKDLAITVGWGHAGKGGVTMPGKGRLIERDYTADELETFGGSPAVPAAVAGASRSHRQEEHGQDAHVTAPHRTVEGTAGEDARATLPGGRTCDVYLNDVAFWKNIPIRVWQYTIGGYQVIKKWLSYREEKLLGRPVTKDEVRWVQEMARRIAFILLMEPALDENYRAVKRHTYEWPKNG
jgi:hypothetical protein